MGEQGGSPGISRSECTRGDPQDKAKPSRAPRASPAVVTSQVLAWLESQSKTYCALTPTPHDVSGTELPLSSFPTVFSREILISGADESLVVIISDYRLQALITLAGE